MKLADLKIGDRFRTYQSHGDCVKVSENTVFLERDRETRTMSPQTPVQSPMFGGQSPSDRRGHNE